MKEKERTMMNKKTTLPLLCGLIVYCVGAFPAFGREDEANLQDKRITIQMEKQPLGEVFRYLMENYDIPIGFEQSSLDKHQPDYDFGVNFPLRFVWKKTAADGRDLSSGHRTGFVAEKHPITINAENERLEEVFNRIVPQMENYKWEINDGVINIFPAKGRDERFAKLLGLHIEKFALAEGKTVMDITDNIVLLPQFSSFLTENKLFFISFRYRETSSNDRKARYGRVLGEKLEFSNLTLRELLNKCTKIKRGGWTLRWVLSSNTPAGWEYIDLDI